MDNPDSVTGGGVASDMALPSDRATHEPSPTSGLGHTVSVPSAAQIFNHLCGHVHQDAVHAKARRAVQRDMTGGFYDEHLFRETMRACAEVFAQTLGGERRWSL